MPGALPAPGGPAQVAGGHRRVLPQPPVPHSLGGAAGLRGAGCPPSTSAPAARGAGGAGAGGRRGLVVTAAVKRSGGKGFVCSKTLRAAAGSEARVADMCKDILDFSLGRAAVRTAGILEYSVSQDLEEPGVLHFWERYDSNVAMGRHNNTPEMQAFMQNVRTQWAGCQWSDCVCACVCVLQS